MNMSDTLDGPGRHFAEQHLHTVLARLAGPGAVPRTDQVDAVHAVLQPASRVLVVQATGWGKSAVYWAATHAIRSSGAVVHTHGQCARHHGHGQRAGDA